MLVVIVITTICSASDNFNLYALSVASRSDVNYFEIDEELETSTNSEAEEEEDLEEEIEDGKKDEQKEEPEVESEVESEEELMATDSEPILIPATDSEPMLILATESEFSIVLSSNSEIATNSILIMVEATESYIMKKTFVDKNLFGVNIPSSYDSRNYGYVTSIKSQGDCGWCWSYAMCATAEVYMKKFYPEYIKALGFDENHEFDLSEAELAYYYSNNSPDPLGNAGNVPRDQSPPNKDFIEAGARVEDVAPFLASGRGFSFDYDYEKRHSLKLVGDNVERTRNIDGKYYYLKDINGVRRVFNTEMPSDNHYNDQVVRLKSSFQIARKDFSTAREYNMSMRQYIYEKGAVKIDLETQSKIDESFPQRAVVYNGEKYTTAYVATPSVEGLHSLCAIGWDDNFPKENFLDGYQPENDGALLVKNSWGTDTGFYWFPYDYEATDTVEYAVMDFMPNLPEYQNTYYYDGGQEFMGEELYATQSIANVFKSKIEKEKINAVTYNGFDDFCILSGDIAIYKIASDNETGLEGEKEQLWSKHLNYGDIKRGMNFYSVDENITLEKDDCFAVILENIHSKDKNGVELSTYSAIRDNDGVESKTTAMNKSFYSDNDYWYNIANGNLCLRVLTEDLVPYDVAFDDNNGHVSTISTTSKYPHKDLIANPTKSGYTFKGWNDVSDGSGRYYSDYYPYDGKSDLKLYAIWTKNQKLKCRILNNKDSKSFYEYSYDLLENDYYGKVSSFVDDSIDLYCESVGFDNCTPDRSDIKKVVISGSATDIYDYRLCELSLSGTTTIDIYLDVVDIEFDNTSESYKAGNLHVYVPFSQKFFKLSAYIFRYYRINQDKINVDNVFYTLNNKVYIGNENIQSNRYYKVNNYVSDDVFETRMYITADTNISSKSYASAKMIMAFDYEDIKNTKFVDLQKRVIDRYCIDVLGIDKNVVSVSGLYNKRNMYTNYETPHNVTYDEETQVEDIANEYDFIFQFSENDLNGKVINFKKDTNTYRTVKLPAIATYYKASKYDNYLMPDKYKTFYKNETSTIGYPIYYNKNENIPLTSANVDITAINNPITIANISYDYDSTTKSKYGSDLQDLTDITTIWTGMDSSKKIFPVRDKIDTTKYNMISYTDQFKNVYPMTTESEISLIDISLNETGDGRIKNEKIYVTLKKIGEKDDPVVPPYVPSGGGGGGGGNYVPPTDIVLPTNDLSKIVSFDSNTVYIYNPLTNKFSFVKIDALGNKSLIIDKWVYKDKSDGKKEIYLTDVDGSMVTGWKMKDNRLYYFSVDAVDYGQMRTGFVKIGVDTFYFAPDGSYKDNPDRVKMFINIH